MEHEAEWHPSSPVRPSRRKQPDPPSPPSITNAHSLNSLEEESHHKNPANPSTQTYPIPYHTLSRKPGTMNTSQTARPSGQHSTAAHWHHYPAGDGEGRCPTHRPRLLATRLSDLSPASEPYDPQPQPAHSSEARSHHWVPQRPPPARRKPSSPAPAANAAAAENAAAAAARRNPPCRSSCALGGGAGRSTAAGSPAGAGRGRRCGRTRRCGRARRRSGSVGSRSRRGARGTWR